MRNVFVILLFLLPLIGSAQIYNVIEVDSSIVRADTQLFQLQEILPGPNGAATVNVSVYMTKDRAFALQRMLYSSELGMMDSGLRATNQERRNFLIRELRKQ